MTFGNGAPASAALTELRDGVAYWRSRKWRPDLHNADYEQWAGQNPNGDFTPEWWHRYQLPRLTRWIATRPVSRKVLTARFAEGIAALGAAWREACLPHLSDDIAAVSLG